MAHRFFTTYAKNRAILRQYSDVINGLSTLEPRILESDRDDIFICPLCIKIFSYRDLLRNPKLLTEEHLPPEKLGGQVQTITCQKCNNRAGSLLENDLKKRLESKEFDNRIDDSIQNVRMSFDNHSDLSGELRYLDGELKLIGDLKRSNPKTVLEMQTAVQKPTPHDFRMNISYKTFRAIHADVACLRIAYLIGFSVCGYGFLLNPSFRIIRKLIENPNGVSLPFLGVVEEDFPDNMLGVNLVVFPSEIKSFLVIFDLISPKSKAITRYGVFLPGPSEPGLKIYSWLDEHEGLEFSCMHIGNQPLFETNPLYSYFLWQDRN